MESNAVDCLNAERSYTKELRSAVNVKQIDISEGEKSGLRLRDSAHSDLEEEVGDENNVCLRFKYEQQKFLELMIAEFS